jgi:hypothetical protein
MSRRIPVALAAVVSAVPAWSQFHASEVIAACDDPQNFMPDEGSLRVEAVELGAAAPPLQPETGTDPSVVLERILNLGQSLWKIIVDNKPVVDVRTQYASALPEGVRGWSSMSGWRPPEGKTYELTAKNAYGMTVVRVRYQVLRSWGGSYEGKGKYLTGVTVDPRDIEVAWGYRVTLEAAAPQETVINVAPHGQEPVAGLTANLSWIIQTPIKDVRGKASYYMQGDGHFRELGAPSARKEKEMAAEVCGL